MSPYRGACCLVLLGLTAASGHAQGVPGDDVLHYTIVPDVIVYQAADSTLPYVSLRMREPVHVIRNGGRWASIRTLDGAQGLVHADELSNVWIRVSKREQTVYVYRGDALAARYAADLGYNFFADKELRGSPNEPDHYRTPQGSFFVASRNRNSRFHRALVLNYPTAEDADRGLEKEWISRLEHDAIVAAERDFRMPPMTTPLGGWVEIHGDGTGHRVRWTQGCIALRNEDLDELWDWVHVGTPVVIDP